MTRKQGSDGYLPTARYVGPNDELRFGEAEYQGGRIYPVSPEAHAKLRAFCLAQREAAAARRKAARRRVELSSEQLEEVIRRHEGGESLTNLAAEFGVSAITLILRLRELGHDTSRRPGKGRRKRQRLEK